ncbi:hypothetical protein Hanom_Chr07g00611431 [Helianthus anomalus]
MHMCIYMYQHEIRCVGTLLSLSSIIPSIIHKHARVHFSHFFDKFRNSLHRAVFENVKKNLALCEIKDRALPATRHII